MTQAINSSDSKRQRHYSRGGFRDSSVRSMDPQQDRDHSAARLSFRLAPLFMSPRQLIVLFQDLHASSVHQRTKRVW